VAPLVFDAEFRDLPSHLLECLGLQSEKLAEIFPRALAQGLERSVHGVPQVAALARKVQPRSVQVRADVIEPPAKQVDALVEGPRTFLEQLRYLLASLLPTCARVSSVCLRRTGRSPLRRGQDVAAAAVLSGNALADAIADVGAATRDGDEHYEHGSSGQHRRIRHEAAPCCLPGRL